MNTTDIKMEVCVDSIASALAAEEGGATRIELCSALSEGGLTPSLGILKELKSLPLTIPIFCMLRPRRGNDFVYSELEVNAILADLEFLRQQGADGFVFGALNAQRGIDVATCRRIVQKAENLPVTFHRAFDLTHPNFMHETVERLKELGFKRILSSGFRSTAIEGSDYLAQLIAKHQRDIIIIPGAGITVGKLDELLTVTKCLEFHSSGQVAAGDDANIGTRMECDVTMGKNDTDPYTITDVNVVRQMVSIAMSAK